MNNNPQKISTPPPLWSHAFSSRHCLEHLILLCLFSTIILPPISLGMYVYMISPASLITFLVALFRAEEIILNRFFTILVFVIFLMLISIIHSYAFLGVPVSVRDFIELIKYFQYLPFLAVVPMVRYASIAKKAHLYFNFSFLFVCCISLFEISNLGNLGNFLGLLYSDESHTQNMLSGYTRLIVTGSDPNVGALIVAFLGLYFWNLFIIKREFFELSKSFILAIILLLTQSRTVLIALVVVGALQFLSIKSISIVAKMIAYFIIILSVIFLVNFFELDYLSLSILLTFDGTNVSVNERIANATIGLERFYQSPFWGYGPAKSIHGTIIDSEVVLIAQRYGLAGILGFCLLFACAFCLFSKSTVDRKNSVFQPFAKSFFWLGGCFMLTNNFFSGYQTCSMIIILLIINSARFNSLGRLRRNFS